MKIGVISDLHIDTNGKALNEDNYSQIVGEIILEHSIDLLLIAGDISNHYEMTQMFLETVQNNTKIPIYFVPGNHDYWAKDHEVTDTRVLHRYFLDKKETLINNPKIINDEWAIVGSPGWYDYGYGDLNKYSVEQYAKKKYKFAYWNDYHYIDWKASDKEVSQKMLKQLKKDIEKVKGYNLILMTHVATHPNFVVPLPNRLYDFVNAYLGAKDYEILYKEYPQIKYSIMGHVHFRKVVKEFGTTFLSACLGNRKHWSNKDDPKKEIEEALLTFKID